MKNITIDISGPQASGKSTLAMIIAAMLETHGVAVVLCEDSKPVARA